MVKKSIPQPNFTFNLKSSNLNAWLPAKAAVIAGTGRASEGLIGDSTQLGVGGPSGADLQANCRAFGMPAQLATLRNASGLPSNYNNSLGQQYGPGQTALSDTRIFPGAAPWVLTGVSSAGGSALKSTGSGTVSSWVMDPFNQVDIWYYGTASTGVFEFAIDGTVVETITSSAAPTNSWHKKTYNTTLGSHTLTFNWVSGGEIHIQGVACRNTAVKAVDMYNLGIGNSTAVTWAVNNTYFPLVLAQALACNLYHVNLGINDLVNASTSNAVFDASIRTIVTALLATGGNVILYAPTPCNNALFIAGIGAYIAILRQIAIDFNIGFVNLYAWLGGVYTAANYYGGNNPLHPNFTTYGNEAVLVDQVTRFY